tara:strand:+ start:423 stop:665 length:243 start_codon:yes stop_codon:yes gene_type:complete
MTLVFAMLAALALIYAYWPSQSGVIDRYYQVDQQHFVRLQAYRALERLIAAQTESTAARTPHPSLTVGRSILTIDDSHTT